MVYDFVFFLKTYRKDYDRAVRLLKTYKEYNMDHIPLFLACPEEDLEVFLDAKSYGVTLLNEHDICSEVFTEEMQWSAGYLNQEIYKLSFWEMGKARNYMCIDSDAVFLRPFYKKDFMYDDATPYTILLEDNDLRADLYYNRQYWNGRMAWIEKIEEAMDFHPYKLLTCHGFQIFSGKVLESLKKEFMEPRGYQYKDLIGMAPYEFTWYNLWLQKTECIPLHICEPLFKTFHLKQHHIFSVLQGMEITDWARGYVGMVLNSNYNVGSGEYEDLSVYNVQNADLSDTMIVRNYRFYRRMMRGRTKRRVKRILAYVKGRLNQRNCSCI